jgi:hypothetical protein
MTKPPRPAEPGSADRPRRDRPRRQHGGEDVQVPRADFRSYYGRPIVKAPVWRHDVPAYLFTGGLAAGSALLAAGADLTGRTRTRKAARLATLGALGLSTYFLINDLGRPERFHHMLRVAKPTSPMSVGTWLLTAFGGAAGLAATAELFPRGRVRRALRVDAAGRAAGAGAAVIAPAIATYTAVLIADTAAPSWHAAYPELPFVFAGSALASGAAVGLIAAPTREGGPARGLAVAGVALELAATHRIETGHGLLSEPYHEGRAGRLLRAARALNLAGAAGALLGRRSRLLSALSGAALLAGSLATRFGIFEAGVESTKDPKYVVEPQRAGLSEP